MMLNIFLLNGPKNCGKDAVANFLVEYHGFHKFEFKGVLYEETAEYYNLPVAVVKFLNRTRWLKERKLPGFKKSIRQMLIHVSEDIIKPLYGPEFFGEELAQKIRLCWWNDWLHSDEQIYNIVISDSGFNEELIGLHTRLHYLFKCSKIHIHVIRIERPGYTFDGDSRNYLRYQVCEDLGIPVYECYNDGTLGSFLFKVRDHCMRMVQIYKDKK